MDGSCYVANRPLATIALPSWRRRSVEALVYALESIWLWHDRARGRRMLLGLDDRMLRDIGVDRAAADHEGTRPFWRP